MTDPIVSITRLENGTTEYHYRRPDPYEPRYSIGQTAVITLAGLAVGSFFAWAIVGVACRLIVWAWS